MVCKIENKKGLTGELDISGLQLGKEPRIDAHQHFWSYEPVQFPWIGTDMVELKRDFHLCQAVELLDKYSFDQLIAVQARADWNENDWLFYLAKQSSRVAGVVGWADLVVVGNEQRLEQLLARPYTVGVRAMLQDMSAPEQIMQSKLFNGYVKRIQQHEIVYELLLRHEQLSSSVDFCSRHDEHYLVVDHLAKPDYCAGLSSEKGQRWLACMQQLGGLPHVYLKLSGLLTEVSLSVLQQTRQWELLFYPFLTAVLECFGARRLVFGSDWPVARLRGNYVTSLGLIDRWAHEHLSKAECSQLFGGNAQRLYSL